MAVKLLLLAGLLADWAIFLLYAPDLDALWAVLLVCLGLFLGILTIRGKTGLAAVLCGLGLLVIPCVVLVRAAPVHSLDWHDVERVEIGKVGEEWSIVMDDPAVLRELESFGHRGFYKTMSKSGYGFHIRVWRGSEDGGQVGVPYYVHGDAVGPRPGGFRQTVFVPSRPGFRDWFEGILKEHGHPH